MKKFVYKPWEYIYSPKQMPAPEDLEFDTWDNFMDYLREYQARQITHLKREKLLLRAALQEAVETAKKMNGFNLTYTSTRWEERILRLTKDKTGD